MWILENEGGAFEGRRLWLRPGKRYLFGRTVAEPGQLAIKGDLSKSVSRKHCTITVDAVHVGDGAHPARRSRVTVEDLGSKGGTRINDNKIKGEKVVLTDDTTTLQMGSFQSKFHITWQPVVLSYSFTAKELRADPLTKLQNSLEQLDIKYLSDYDNQRTTHIVTRKRNTAKGLQALVCGRYIVGSDFVDAVVAAASPPAGADSYAASLLEGDFDGNWPDATHYLPPATDDGVLREDALFAPNPGRAEIFDGYTFVFYDKKQWDTLMAPITAGKGKALLHEIVPKETQVDDFIRYVKGVAGEKGLGEFEDGSEGRGVVVVRWLPTDGDNLEWYTDFYTTISLRLDHRLIDQKDFIGSILGNDASVLRRPLEEEDSQAADTGPHGEQEGANTQSAQSQDSISAPRLSALRRRARGAGGSRFKGFGIDIDEDEEPTKPVPTPAKAPPPAVASQESLFVAQNHDDDVLPDASQDARRSPRKRAASPAEREVDIMEGFAPTAAQVKRRRIEAGEDPVPRRSSPSPEASKRPVEKPVKVKKEIDVLDVARQHREEAEARARAERQELETAPDGLDLAEIRRLQITEPMALREVPSARTREQDVADGRWDPAWNGRKNFKKFQRRGAEQGRLAQKIIVPLEQVQTKAFGIGADYWLEDASQQKGRKKQSERSQKSGSRNNTQTQDDRYDSAPVRVSDGSRAARNHREPEKLSPVDSDEDEEEAVTTRGGRSIPTGTHDGDDDDDDDGDDVVISMSAPRSSRATARSAVVGERQSQTSQAQGPPPTSSSRSGISAATQNTTQRSQVSRGTAAAMASIRGKRPAAEGMPIREQPAKKRPKAAAVVVAASDDDDDDSEDELRFKFRKR